MVNKLTTHISTSFFSILVMPFIILNLFSGLAAGVWLAAIGQWELILYGIGMTLLMPWIYMFVNLPGMGFAAITYLFARKRSKYGVYFFGCLYSFYDYALLSGWCLLVLDFFTSSIETGSPIPYLLAAHATTMAPLGYMASKEPPDSTATTVGLFYTQMFFLFLVILWLLNIPFEKTIIFLISIIMIFSFVITSISVRKLMNEFYEPDMTDEWKQ